MLPASLRTGHRSASGDRSTELYLELMKRCLTYWIYRDRDATELGKNSRDAGYLIVDDYGAVLACREAVHDYRARHGITDKILPIDWSGVYWRQSEAGSPGRA